MTFLDYDPDDTAEDNKPTKKCSNGHLNFNESDTCSACLNEGNDDVEYERHWCEEHNLPETFDSNPFNGEIYDDWTNVWMCYECRYNAAMDI